MVQRNANKGLAKVYWFLILSAVILLVLGVAFWWYDAYLFQKS